METVFEANFKPERDFVDFLEMKKERHYEQHFEKSSAEISKKQQKERNPAAQEGGSSLVDDQDLRPMDLEAEQQM